MTSESPLSAGNVEASKPEPEVRYVLSGQPTGWAAMGKEVREFDEEKIRNSKEDIDTLLVFAGLFSAVLSAFVVAAYPSLQPDRMDTVVYTLQVIAAQTAGYHLTGNAITSSPAPLPPLPAFKPASNDIRVNILWFASLVISLITASFAMLVKQWLREFLAVDVPSPQARLRIRHFREPQLRKWMVFEIAASLPLLLQLSLGLFFVGLCYFTAAIHANIGYTTLPLVVGWALFFFTVSALPIFFPRCPYGNTLVKAVVTQLHRKIKLVVRWAHSRSQSDSAYPEPSFFLNGLYRAWSSCCALLRSVLQRTLPEEKHLPDEREIVKAQDQDINILVSVDAIQANDELLVTAMAEAFHYCQPDWKDAVSFVVQVLAHRLPTVAESDRVLFEWPFYGASPLLSLRPRVLECIAKILSESANHLPFGYKSIFLLNPPNDGGHGRIEYQRTESVQMLCMFSLTVAAASVSIQSITSNPGLLGFLQQLFDRSEYSGVLQLSKDWLQVAMGKHSMQLNGLPPSPTTLPQAVGSLLRVVTELVEPAKISLTKGVELVEALTETKIDTWGQTVEWTTLASGHILHSTVVEIYLQALLHGEFQHRVATDSESESSMTYSSSTSPAETGRVLRAILRAMLHKESNNVARYFRQRTSLCCLSRIVELAARDESCTEYLLDVLLDRSGPDGHPNSFTLTRLNTGINRRIWDALYRFERSGRYSATERKVCTGMY
ncbi:hypothetical protein BC629DRAFT_496633 [Irpex lacteus]|nr:hypothetical protein BC629DRAFT_496633 [Irpex lacteus]